MSKENIINLLLPNNNIEFTIKSIETIECCSYIDLSERFSDAIGVLIIETNRFSLIINSESVIPQENMMVLLGAGNKINISPIDPMFPLYLHILCIGQPDFDDLKLLKEKFFFYQPANILPYVEKFNEIHSNIVRNDFTSKLYIKMRLYEFIYDLANDYRSLAKSTDIYSQIKAYIDSHYTDVLSIQFLSDLFGVSYKTIERQFKANSGLTPQQYVTDLRKNPKYLVFVNPSKQFAISVDREHGGIELFEWNSGKWTHLGEFDYSGNRTQEADTKKKTHKLNS